MNGDRNEDRSALAIIPARGGSKRLPRKNVRDFLGRPVIHYAIETALESGRFDDVIVSTDDELIAKIARDGGASVPFLRSPENATDTASTVDVLVEVLERLQKEGRLYSSACCIYPVTPLLRPVHIQQAFELLEDGPCDVVIPVVAYSHPIQRALRVAPDNELEPLWPEKMKSRTQDLEETYHDAGQFYLFRTAHLLETRDLWSGRLRALVLDETEVQDVDSETDWKLAEMKYRLANR